MTTALKVRRLVGVKAPTILPTQLHGLLREAGEAVSPQWGEVWEDYPTPPGCVLKLDGETIHISGGEPDGDPVYITGHGVIAEILTPQKLTIKGSFLVGHIPYAPRTVLEHCGVINLGGDVRRVVGCTVVRVSAGTVGEADRCTILRVDGGAALVNVLPGCTIGSLGGRIMNAEGSIIRSMEPDAWIDVAQGCLLVEASENPDGKQIGVVSGCYSLDARHGGSGLPWGTVTPPTGRGYRWGNLIQATPLDLP